MWHIFSKVIREVGFLVLFGRQNYLFCKNNANVADSYQFSVDVVGSEAALSTDHGTIGMPRHEAKC